MKAVRMMALAVVLAGAVAPMAEARPDRSRGDHGYALGCLVAQWLFDFQGCQGD